MTVDEHRRLKSLTIRRPGDAPAATPLAWQIDKHTEHNGGLPNNAISPVGLDTEDIKEFANDEDSR